MLVVVHDWSIEVWLWRAGNCVVLFFIFPIVTFYALTRVCQDLERSVEKSHSSFHPFEISNLFLMIVAMISNRPGTCSDLVDLGIQWQVYLWSEVALFWWHNMGISAFKIGVPTRLRLRGFAAITLPLLEFGGWHNPSFDFLSNFIRTAKIFRINIPCLDIKIWLRDCLVYSFSLPQNEEPKLQWL